MNDIFQPIIERIRLYDVDGATRAYVALLLGSGEHTPEERQKIAQEARETIQGHVDRQRMRMNTRKDRPDETIPHQEQ
jgi:hypothetical protein